jgi:hypothetical protein
MSVSRNIANRLKVLTAVPEDLIYSGQVKLTDAVENSPNRAEQWALLLDLCTDYQKH